MDEAPFFRPPKRRKFTSSRQDDDNLEPPSSDQQGDVDRPFNNTANGLIEDEPTSVVRARKLHRSTLHGLTFSASSRADVENHGSSALIPHDAADEKLNDMSHRFTGSTGQAVDVDQHMYVRSISPFLWKSKWQSLTL